MTTAGQAMRARDVMTTAGRAVGRRPREGAA